MEKRVCAVCGAELPKGRRKYCSERCRAKAEKARAKENYVQIRGAAGVFREGLICMDCGRAYDGTIKTKRCPACQEKANQRHNAEYRERAKVGAQRKIGSTDLCARCGKPYVVEGGLQRYCKACAQIAFKENKQAITRKSNKEYYANSERRQEKLEASRIKRPLTEVCPICGKQFEAKNGEKYCSDECRREKNRRYKSREKTETCLVCGKEFWSKNGAKLCSDECRRERKRRYATEARTDTCPICGKQFDVRNGAKLCSEECRREWVRRRDRAYRKRRKEETALGNQT